MWPLEIMRLIKIAAHDSDDNLSDIVDNDVSSDQASPLLVISAPTATKSTKRKRRGSPEEENGEAASS